MSSPLCNPKFLEHLTQSKAKTKLRMHLKADRIIDRVYSQVLADLHLFFTFDHEVVTPREEQSGGEPPVLSPCTTQQHLIQSLNVTPLDVSTVPNVSQNGDRRFDEFQVPIPRSIISITKQSASLSEPINSYPTHQITQHDNDMDNSSSRDDSNEPEVKQEFDEAITELVNLRQSFVQSNEKANEELSNEPMATGLAHCLPSLPQPNGQVQLNSISNQQFQGIRIKQEIVDSQNVQLEPQLRDHSINFYAHEPLFPESNILSTSPDQSLPNIEMQSQPQQELVDIDHDQFDEEECECDECVYGGFEVKEEDDDDDSDGVEWIDDDQEDEESLLPAKRLRIDSTQESTDEANPNEDKRPDEESDEIGTEQSAVSGTQSTNDHAQYNSDDDMVIQQNQNDTNNAIKGQIANASITNPTQPDLVQPNRHFQCPHCPKSFDQRCRFEKHFRVHTGERPFECDQCGKRFTQKVSLDSHLRTHSGERPFQCRFCEQCFAVLSTRKRHEQAKHHHVRPYRCKVCGLTATTRSTMITHIRIVHFGLPQTLKEQRERNIVDNRDTRDWFEKVEQIV